MKVLVKPSVVTRWNRRMLISFLHPAGTVYILLASAPAIVACLIASFRWPLVHDAPLMHYIAWRILSGAVPYRDLFDMNMPGVYVLHILVLKLFGPSDLGWRLFDLLWLLLTTGAIYLLCRPVNRWAGFFSAVFFFSFHLSAGAINMGQRDFLLCAFLLLSAHFLALSIERRGCPKWALLAGLFLGAGTSVKPHCALYGAFMIVLLISYAHRGQFPWKKEVLLLVTGMAAIPLLMVSWLIWVGGLDPMLKMTFEYLLPFYAKLGNIDTLTLTLVPLEKNAFWIWVVLLACWQTPKSFRYWLIAQGAVFGWFSFVLQGKGWGYHLYPFEVFLYTLLGMSLVALFSRRALLSRLVAFSCFSLFMYLVAMRCWVVSRTPMSSDLCAKKIAIVKGMVTYLRPRFDPDRDTIQVVDEAEGGIHGLLLLRAVEPTRFIYDYQFLPEFKSQFARDLLSEFIEGLRNRRPRYIVVFDDGTWRGPRGHGRVKLEFPEIDRVLTQSYTMELSSRAYDVYRRKDGDH
jgi:hypothetical protein